MTTKKHTSPVNAMHWNPELTRALDIMENTKKNVFVTGRAGTGKSTLLSYVRDNTKKKIVVLAPTGVAAVNVGGQTIHSFFGFKPDITEKKVSRAYNHGEENIFKHLDAIVIDEISMVRADLLDCIDKFLRLNGKDKYRPFGGIQMIFIGDLYQLPPVVVGEAEKALFTTHYDSPYFFSSKVFGGGPQKKFLVSDGDAFEMEFVELETIYRQSDEVFISVLNAIRNNTAGDNEIALINSRLDPSAEPDMDEFTVYLTPTNAVAKEINDERLARLPGKEYAFEGVLRGRFDRRDLPTEEILHLKIGAQVMLLNNDTQGRWINGTIGALVAVEKDEEGERTLVVELDGGERVEVGKNRWDQYEFHLEKNSGDIETDSIGSFTQYPVKLAWALTIHKAQGKTFPRVIFDIGKGTFAPGQLYVALSRCVSLEGLTLKKPIDKKHVWMDWRVTKFITGFQYEESERLLSFDDKCAMIEKAIEEKTPIDIVYLKAKDVKSRRTILPHALEEMEYEGHPFVGVSAYCFSRKEDRVFRVDRILEMRFAEKKKKV